MLPADNGAPLPGGQPDPPKVNILLVDDQPGNLLALEAILQGLGQNLVKAPSGEDALRQLLAGDFAVILLDVQMGGMDGFETARLVRGRDRSRHTPIIFLTAHASPDFPVAEAYRLGAVDYLVKPLVPKILRAKVEGFVELFQKTERVRKQAERLRLLERRELEHRLAEEALRQRAELLAEADRRKNEWIAMLSHELRNPLTALVQGLYLLRDAGQDRGTAEELLGLMERQTQHTLRLVDDLLDVSRISHGKVQLRPERLDLSRLVRTAAEDRRRSLEQAGLTLTVEVPETPLWATGDPTRLSQVLNNLLHNAAKFTEPGGSVGVRLTADGARTQAVLTVRDTGMGIERDVLPRLFEPFCQADRSLDRTQGGLGLGACRWSRGWSRCTAGRPGPPVGGPGRGRSSGSGSRWSRRAPDRRGLGCGRPCPRVSPAIPRWRTRPGSCRRCSGPRPGRPARTPRRCGLPRPARARPGSPPAEAGCSSGPPPVTRRWSSPLDSSAGFPTPSVRGQARSRKRLWDWDCPGRVLGLPCVPHPGNGVRAWTRTPSPNWRLSEP
jgi:signal transduction histidine kinase